MSAAIMGVARDDHDDQLRARVAASARPASVDFVGAGILAVGLSALLIAVSRGNDWGWGSDKTLGLIAVGLLVLAVFGVFERRHSAPLVNMRRSRAAPGADDRHRDAAGRLRRCSARSCWSRSSRSCPRAATSGFGLNATEAGLLLAPGGLLCCWSRRSSASVGERFGSKPPFLVGCLSGRGALLGLALRARLASRW